MVTPNVDSALIDVGTADGLVTVTGCMTPSYLSGVLIGHDISAMQDLYPPDEQALLRVSAASLRMPYERALRRAGYRPYWIDARLASLRGVGRVINHSWKTQT